MIKNKTYVYHDISIYNGEKKHSNKTKLILKFINFMNLKTFLFLNSMIYRYN